MEISSSEVEQNLVSLPDSPPGDGVPPPLLLLQGPSLTETPFEAQGGCCIEMLIFLKMGPQIV